MNDFVLMHFYSSTQEAITLTLMFLILFHLRIQNSAFLSENDTLMLHFYSTQKSIISSVHFFQTCFIFGLKTLISSLWFVHFYSTQKQLSKNLAFKSVLYSVSRLQAGLLNIYAGLRQHNSVTKFVSVIVVYLVTP